jgi:hypothetical protein
MWTTSTVGYGLGGKTFISTTGGVSLTTPPIKF